MFGAMIDSHWTPAVRDEKRHAAGTDPWWGETWGFEFVDSAHDLAAFVRYVVYPKRGSCWFWVGVIYGDEPVVLCRDLSVPVPSQPAVLEIRSSALWSHAICETPFEHWSVAMEAYAVALDDPAVAYSGEFGDRIGLAFDLEWETRDSRVDRIEEHSGELVRGYRQTSLVTGDLQLDDAKIEVTATGQRDHLWGCLDPEWFVERMGQVTEGDRWVGWVLDEDGESTYELARSLRNGMWV